jgi:hypothetical protein
MFPGTPKGQDSPARLYTPMEPDVGCGRAGSTAGPGGRRRFLNEGEKEEEEGSAAAQRQRTPVTKFVSMSNHKILVIGRRMSRSDEPPTTPSLAPPPVTVPPARAAVPSEDHLGGSAGMLKRNFACTPDYLAEPVADSVGRQDHPKVRTGWRHGMGWCGHCRV